MEGRQAGAASQPLGVPPLAPETGPGASPRLSHFPTRFSRDGEANSASTCSGRSRHSQSVLASHGSDAAVTAVPIEMRACASPGPRPQSRSEAGPAPGPRTAERLGGLRGKPGTNPGAIFSRGAGAVTLTTGVRRGRPGAPGLPRALPACLARRGAGSE